MAGVFLFRPIKAKFLSPREVRARILNTCIAEGKVDRAELEKTTATWVEHNPKFETEIKFAKGDITVSTTTEEEIWGYLNRGTRTRWAVMSSDWVSKTTPGSISSGAGAGFVTVKGQGAMTRLNMPPRKGITARNWTVIVRQERSPIFNANIRKAVVSGLRARQAKP